MKIISLTKALPEGHEFIGLKLDQPLPVGRGRDDDVDDDDDDRE